MIKRVLGLFLVLLLGFVLIACEESEKETEELNVVIAGLSQPQERVFFTTFVRLFEARYDAQVNVTYTVEGDLRQKIETEQTANNVVTDVVMVHSSALNAYINNDWMVDLTSVVAGFEERTITDIFDTETTREGKTYFIPINFDVYISIYNVAALPYIPSTVDVTRNTSDQITQINHITWEEYAEWAIAIADATETPKSGFPMATTGSQLLYPMGGMALAYGSESYPLLNDAGALAAWNKIAEMAAGDAILSEAVLSESNQPGVLLQSGQLWMSFGHMGPIGAAFAAAPSNYVLGPAPVSEATGMAGSTAGAATYGIIKGAPNQELAELWLEFITEPEINYLYCSGLGGVISTVAEVVDQLGTSNTDKIMAAGLAVLESGAKVTGLPTYLYTSWDSVKAVYTNLYRRLLEGTPLTQSEADVFQNALEALLVE